MDEPFFNYAFSIAHGIACGDVAKTFHFLTLFRQLKEFQGARDIYSDSLIQAYSKFR
jgi:hypothetical protein